MITAIEFGLLHKSCLEAMVWRRSLSEGAEQDRAWRGCSATADWDHVPRAKKEG